tara:strand:+ start:1285 stop:1818 length:534 start_codon:yes stop_codon:yes gene_type:complete
MKFTGNNLTLRGTASDIPANGSYKNFTILDYANVLDINKGWRVRWIEILPTTLKGQSDTRLSIDSILATDDIGSSGPDQVFEDNRQIGWTKDHYLIGKDGAQQIANDVQGYLASKIIIDPDHIIQRRLDINLKVLGANAAEAELYRINYIVYLEEVTLSANEAIISNIKSVAQDVDN